MGRLFVCVVLFMGKVCGRRQCKQCPIRVLSCVVVVSRAHRGGSVPRSAQKGAWGTSVDVEFVCNEAVLSRGRGPGLVHKGCSCRWGWNASLV